MANLITDSRTWEGQEADEIFAKPIFTEEVLGDEFRIVQNVTSKKKLTFDTSLSKILKAKASGCARDNNNKLITLSERELSVDTVGFDLEQCSIELSDAIEEQWLNKGNDIYDLNGTFIKSYLESKVQDALKLDIPRVTYFADKASVDANYNMADGMWKMIFAYGAANPGMIGTTIPSSLDPSTEAGAKIVIGIFKDLYDRQPTAMRAVPKAQKKFIVNGELKEMLADAYTTLGGAPNGDIFIARTQEGEGEDLVKYKGIVVEGKAYWTEIIESDFGGSQLYRAILTVKGNFALGTDRLQDQMRVDFMYHPYQRVNTLESRFKLGSQLLHPEFTVYSTSAAV
jgi:hypothetical protein